MSLYIKGIDIPQDGIVRVIMIESDGSVRFYGGSSVIARAVQLPPHGDLFDRDLLEVVSYHNREGTEDDAFDAGVRWLLEHIDGLLPVIRADPAEEEPT